MNETEKDEKWMLRMAKLEDNSNGFPGVTGSLIRRNCVWGRKPNKKLKKLAWPKESPVMEIA